MLNECKMVFKKPSALISISGDLTCRGKKLFSMLCFAAYCILQKNENISTFELPIPLIKDLCDFNKSLGSGDIDAKIEKSHRATKGSLHGILKLLVDTSIEYNIFGKDGNEWGYFSPVAFVAIKNGIVTFCFPQPILKILSKLYPVPYATIDLMVIRELKHIHNITYYEFLKDYKNIKTPWISANNYRRLLGYNTRGNITYISNIIHNVERNIDELEEKAGVIVTHKVEKVNGIITQIRIIPNWIKMKQDYNFKRDELMTKLDAFINNHYVKDVKSAVKRVEKSIDIGNIMKDVDGILVSNGLEEIILRRQQIMDE